MEGSRYKILFIAKWYLHRNDPQFAVYITKHAKAISAFADVAVLHVLSDEKLNGKRYDEVITKEGNLLTVQVYFKKSTGIFAAFINTFRYLAGVGKGLKSIRKNFGDYDLIHAYILLRPVVVAWWLKFTRGKKYIVSEQWSGYATGKFSERNFLVRMLSRFMVSGAEVITTVSGFLKDSMIQSGLRGKYVVIPNIIEVSSGGAAEKKAGEKIKILVVADLVDEIKNISGTIRAFAEVYSVDNNAELDIIGQGKDERKLKDLVHEHGLNQSVFFHGVKSNEDVYRFLERCDFLVMNSNFETFSLICAEAISCGKPVIATRCGGPQEFVTEGTGILTEPGNHKQLVAAIRHMLATYRSYSAERLKKYAIDRFSAEIIGKEFLKVYASVLAK